MCKQNERLTLCTCEDESEPDRPVLKWKLYKATGPRYQMGRAVPPPDTLGQGFTADRVLKDLNSGNCFDFDYVPVDGDSLTIGRDGSNSLHLIFSFSQGRWFKSDVFALPEPPRRSMAEGDASASPCNQNVIFSVKSSVKTSNLNNRGRLSFRTLGVKYHSRGLIRLMGRVIKRLMGRT
jgi:hypothetical protein